MSEEIALDEHNVQKPNFENLDCFENTDEPTVLNLNDFMKNISPARFIYNPGHSLTNLNCIAESDFYKKNPKMSWNQALEYLLRQRDSYVATFEQPTQPIKTPQNLQRAKSDANLGKQSQILVPGWMLLVRSLILSILHYSSFSIGLLFVALSVHLISANHSEAVVVSNIIAICFLCMAFIVGMVLKSKFDLALLPCLSEHQRFVFMLELVAYHAGWFKIVAWSSLLGFASFLANILCIIWDSSVTDGCKWSISAGVLLIFVISVVFICNLTSYVGYEFIRLAAKYDTHKENKD